MSFKRGSKCSVDKVEQWADIIECETFFKVAKEILNDYMAAYLYISAMITLHFAVHRVFAQPFKFIHLSNNLYFYIALWGSCNGKLEI